MALAAMAALPVAGALLYGAATMQNPIVPATPSVAPSSAARFLTQATFGPNDASISDVQNDGFSAWISNQEGMAPSQSVLTGVDNRLIYLRLTNPSIQLQNVD